MTDLDTQTRLRIDITDLLDFATAVFTKTGLPTPRATASAEALCYGDLTGMSSHGLANLTRIYLPLLESGRSPVDAEPAILADRGASVLLDAAGALGLWQAGEAMDLAVRRAREYGIGLVSVRGGTHFGCAGPHALRAVRHGMVGVVAANCGHQRIARPPGGRLPMLGTNPLSIAAPAGQHPPFVLDMSTTSVPTGRVRAAARAGEPIPPTWLTDDDGAPVTDPAAFDRGEAHLTWLGGPGSGGYKGFGLALLVEVLAALVPGAGVGPAPEALTGATPPDDDIGFLLLAIDPGRDNFPADAAALFGAILDCPPIDPANPVGYPGLPEAEHERLARRDGVPLSPALYRELGDVGDRLGVPLPMGRET